MIGEYDRQVLCTNGVFNNRAVKSLAKEFKLTNEHSNIILNSLFYYYKGVMLDDYDYRNMIINGLLTFKLHKSISDKSKTFSESKKEFKYKKLKSYQELLKNLPNKNTRKRFDNEYAEKFIAYVEGEPFPHVK